MRARQGVHRSIRMSVVKDAVFRFGDVLPEKRTIKIENNCEVDP